MNHARRIQARAVRRMGELLEAIEPQSGGDRKSNGGHPPLDTRTSAARSAGLSEHQQKQAVRVARGLPLSPVTPFITAQRCQSRLGQGLLRSYHLAP